MAGVVSEDYLSRPFTLGQQAGRELVYNVVDAADEEEVRTLVLGVAPTAYLGRALESVSAEPAGGRLWKASAKYVRFDGGDEYTFDTGGGTVKVTQSLGTTAYAPAGATAPDFNGAIGVTEDSVEGVDVTSPSFEFTETHRFADAFILAGFKLTLFNLTGRVNNATFKGLAAGECLFLGAAGTKRGDELWSITFRFAGSPNATGLTVGSITGITKKGWDYLWVRYADFADNFAFQLVKRPAAVYVEKVYPDGDFSLLTIGT